MGALFGQIARRNDASTGWGRDRGYAERTGGLDMYKCVSLRVVLWLLCVVGGNVLPKKKTAKKEALCVEGAGRRCEQPKRMLRALGQTYVRQS